MSEAKVEQFLDIVAKQRAKLILDECKSNDDALALASAYLTEAQTIYRAIGGEKMVALMMYHSADDAAAKSDA